MLMNPSLLVESVNEKYPLMPVKYQKSFWRGEHNRVVPRAKGFPAL